MQIPYREIQILKDEALKLCHEIERLPASEQQTKVSIKAAALHQSLQRFLYEKCDGERRRMNFRRLSLKRLVYNIVLTALSKR